MWAFNDIIIGTKEREDMGLFFIYHQLTKGNNKTIGSAMFLPSDLPHLSLTLRIMIIKYGNVKRKFLFIRGCDEGIEFRYFWLDWDGEEESFL